MTPNLIPISTILLGDRQRIDHSNTDGLKESLFQYGTIEPIILEPVSENSYRLIAGGRRLRFLQELGHETLYHGSVYDAARPGFVLGRELSKDELHELELEENIRRKAMTWQEKALATANLHSLKTIRFGSEGKKWTQRLTGEMFGLSLGKVQYSLALAGELRNKTSPLWAMESAFDGVRWLAQQEENKALAELARRQAVASAAHIETEDDLNLSLSDDPPDAKELARVQYLSNPHNDPQDFDAYYGSRQQVIAPKVYLTPRIHLGDCLSFMSERPNVFDHIITDPPYAIDMGMLKQDHLGMQNIDTVAGEHEVLANHGLLFNFIERAYSSLKDRGFLVLWCDYSMWQQLYEWTTRIGFAVQRWPVVWVKSYMPMNSAAQYNFHKTTEIAMICRKGNATLVKAPCMGHIIASHDEYKDQMSHPFVKPFAVWKHLVEAVSLEGQLIYDPFAGHGSGPISFLRLNRNYMASEVNPTHYNHLMENLKKYYLGLNPNTTFV